MKRYRFFKMFIHTVYTCNMSCRGCVTLNDQPRRGVESFDDLVASMEQWSLYLDPKWILVFGGEPLMHPRYKDICREIRRLWPNAKISIPTNALLLQTAADAQWLDEIKPVEIRVSYHHKDSAEQWFKHNIKEFMSVYKGWKYNTEESLHPDMHRNQMLFNQSYNGVSLGVAQMGEFIRTYDIDNQGQIQPYNNDPQEAFEHCVSPQNVYLYKDQLWKCLPYPNLKDTQPDFENRWPQYRPYSIGDDLTTYFNNMNRAENICSMCPNSRSLEQQHSISHLDSQNVKILPSPKWIQKTINNTRTNKDL
jgi:organic radical activating enzyme